MTQGHHCPLVGTLSSPEQPSSNTAATAFAERCLKLCHVANLNSSALLTAKSTFNISVFSLSVGVPFAITPPEQAAKQLAERGPSACGISSPAEPGMAVLCHAAPWCTVPRQGGQQACSLKSGRGMQNGPASTSASVCAALKPGQSHGDWGAHTHLGYAWGEPL